MDPLIIDFGWAERTGRCPICDTDEAREAIALLVETYQLLGEDPPIQPGACILCKGAKTFPPPDIDPGDL